MHQLKDKLPIAVSAGEATIRSATFGDMAVNLVQVPKGTDFGPLIEGLPHNLCQCSHWGYLLKGNIHIRYADGKEETVGAGEVFFWPAGHTGWVDEDTSFLEFSPAKPMREFLDHLTRKLGTPEPVGSVAHTDS